MLTTVSYARAKRVVRARKPHGGLATCYPDIRYALERLGVRTDGTRRKFSTWATVEGRAIVAIEQVPRRAGCWHWVVFDRVEGVPVVWDPARETPNAIRVDFRRMKGRHYMLVGLPDRAAKVSPRLLRNRRASCQNDRLRSVQ